MATKASRSIWRAPNGQDYPLEDAKNGILATITEADISCAVGGNPCECAIAQSFKRAAASPEVLIGRSIAYVVVRQDGEEKALRFRVPPATRRAIDHFDTHGDMPAETLKLETVHDGDRLESKRAADKRMRQRWAVTGHTRRPAIVDLSHRNAVTLATTRVRPS